MNKAQATDYIISRLQEDFAPQEIVEELSRALNAPPELIDKFVHQVAESHPTLQPAQRPVAESSTLEAQQSQQAVTQPPVTGLTAETEASSSSMLDGLPPGLKELVLQAETNPAAFKSTENTNTGSPKTPAPQLQPVHPAAGQRKETAEELPDIERQKLVEYILQNLKKQRRHTDIIEYVCEQTGWHWNKAQRFVARVQTQHHDELQAGKNKVLAWIGAAIILIGLVIMGNGAAVLWDYFGVMLFARDHPEALLYFDPQAALIGFSAVAAGFGMIIGGGYGIAKALSEN